MDRTEQVMKINAYSKVLNLATEKLQRVEKVDIESEEVEMYLVLYYGLNYNQHDKHIILSDKQLTDDDIVQIALSEKKNVLTHFTLEAKILPEHACEDLLKKAQIKVKGDIWIIHKGDVDPFPSKPHAHNYNENIKVHLGNGELYRKKDNVGKLERKKYRRLIGEV